MRSMCMRGQKLTSSSRKRKGGFFGKVYRIQSNQSDILERKQIHFLIGL
nr:MAG TPA: hypothetical protein [Caudoviricetes sp.]